MDLLVSEISNYNDVLPNGLTVATIEMPHIHTLELAMVVRAGLRLEEKSNNGVSHFLEHMMFRGNRSFPDSLSLNREFETIGKDLRASTMTEYTYFGFSPHPKKLDRAMEIFAEFFSGPRLTSIELERQIILEEYLEDLNAEGENVDVNNVACNLLYKGSSLSLPIIGDEESIKSIQPEMLRDYFEKYYHPGNMILVGAGRISHQNFLELADRYFSSLPSRGKGVAKNYFQDSVSEDQQKPELAFQYDADSQVQLQICFRSCSYNDPDYYKVNMISDIFDDGVTSRLQRVLREEKALVYSVECRATSLSDTGTFDFDVGVRPEKVTQVAQILFAEIKLFLEEGPTLEELEHVKNRHCFDLEFELDDPYKQIVRHAFSELYSTQVSVEEERQIIREISAGDLWETGKKFFRPEKLNVVAVGPLTDKIKSDLEALAGQF